MSKGAKPTALLTLPDAAKELGVSVSTMRRWVYKGRVPSTRNEQGWPLVRLEDIPPELLSATRKHSAAQRRAAVVEQSQDAKMEWLQDQLAEAIRIIAHLTGSANDG